MAPDHPSASGDAHLRTKFVVHNRMIKPHPHSSWYTVRLRVMKRELSRLERRSKKTLLNIDLEIFNKGKAV